MAKPLLLIDVDGVISLFGFDPARPPAGRFALIDGVAHFLSANAGQHLRELAADYELAWCTGWEEKANEHLPLALGLPHRLPHLALDPTAAGHWKLAAIDRYTRPSRPLAWIDDDHDETSQHWAATRPGPTLLLTTNPTVGLATEHVRELQTWARTLT